MISDGERWDWPPVRQNRHCLRWRRRQPGKGRQGERTGTVELKLDDV